VSKPIALRAVAGEGSALAPRSEYARWYRALAAASCLFSLGAVAPPAVADQSVIDLINKTPAQKAAAQSTPALRAPAARAAARPKTAAKATAAKAPAAKPAAPVPLPDQALMAHQPAPDCAFRGPLSNPITAEETRMKLDYEAQCYRQAEAIVRARLQQLQDTVGKTIKASGQRSPVVSSR